MPRNWLGSIPGMLFVHEKGAAAMSVKDTITQYINQLTVIHIPITESMDLHKDLYLDSLSFVCLLTDIEEHYNITIELPEMAHCRIVGQLISLVESKLGEETKNDYRCITGKMGAGSSRCFGGRETGILRGSGAAGIDTAGRFAERGRPPGCSGPSPGRKRFHLRTVRCPSGRMDGFPIKHAPDRTGAPMLLLASSGTTGSPKLVRLSESSLIFNTSAYLRHMGYEKYRDPSPRYALGTPFSGIYGLLIIFSCVLRGFPLLAMAEGFTPDALFKAAQEHRISHYDGGTVAAILLERTIGRHIPYDITSLRYFGFGGSKAPDGTLGRLTKAYPNIRFWSGYGMTEASPLIAQPYRGPPQDKLDSVGVPLPGVKVCLQTETGKTEEPDQLGEIIVQGPNVMLGCYNDEQATEEIFCDGWLHTGDIGYFDDDGYLYICGRKKNMLLVRGFNVYPEEVETCLQSCPLVENCVVYGRTDVPGSECVCADIVPAAKGIGLSSIQNWCAGRLADYKCPCCIRFVEELDRTATGKNKRTQKEASG